MEYQGALSKSSKAINGYPVESYFFDVTKTHPTIRIGLLTSDFPPQLIIVSPENKIFRPHENDGLKEHQSEVVLQDVSPGIWQILVSSATLNRFGRYTITITKNFTLTPQEAPRISKQIEDVLFDKPPDFVALQHAGNSTVKQSANIAIGENNKANMGSVNMKGGPIGKTGVITNKSQVKEAANIAIGKGNEANLGSINMNDAKVDGKLTNDSKVEQAANIAIGEKNKATMGSFNMEGGPIGTAAHATNNLHIFKKPNTPMYQVTQKAQAPMSPPDEPPPPFPWPPPQASAETVLQNTLIRLTGESDLTFGDIDNIISNVLEKAGYFEKCYFGVPKGFALVTRLEQINPDGTSKDPPARWAIEIPPLQHFSLSEYFKALLTANPGYFRVIVFIVTSSSFSQTDKHVVHSDTIVWFQKGLNKLPESCRILPYTQNHNVTVLIYEFEKPRGASVGDIVVPGHNNISSHLAGAGLIALLEDKHADINKK